MLEQNKCPAYKNQGWTLDDSHVLWMRSKEMQCNIIFLEMSVPAQPPKSSVPNERRFHTVSVYVCLDQCKLMTKEWMFTVSSGQSRRWQRAAYSQSHVYERIQHFGLADKGATLMSHGATGCILRCEMGDNGRWMKFPMSQCTWLDHDKRTC